MNPSFDKITRAQFEAYERVRESGVTNMWDARVVSMLSGLTKEQILTIIENYEELLKKYPNVREQNPSERPKW